MHSKILTTLFILFVISVLSQDIIFDDGFIIDYLNKKYTSTSTTTTSTSPPSEKAKDCDCVPYYICALSAMTSEKNIGLDLRYLWFLKIKKYFVNTLRKIYKYFKKHFIIFHTFAINCTILCLLIRRTISGMSWVNATIISKNAADYLKQCSWKNGFQIWNKT